MLAIRLESEIEERLAALARKTGHTKTYHAREAIIEHLGEMEDGYLALDRLKDPARIRTAQEVKRELGL
jgi:RHH-type transcriptional regulator, rel operon repressor / antitoxin RelB